MDDVTIKGLTEDAVIALSESYGEPAWLRDVRLGAFKAFTDMAWPHKRVEEWRYTDPARFDLERPVLLADGSDAAPSDGGIIAAADAAGGLAASVRIVDGHVHAAVVSAEAAASGVVITDFTTAASKHEAVLREHLGSVVPAGGKFEAASLAAFTGSVLVHVPAEVELSQPIAITVHATQPGAILPRVLVVADAYAKAAVYVDHRGQGRATVIDVVETVLGEAARVGVVTSQDWGPDVDQIGSRSAVVGRGARYRHLEVTLGGGTLYIRPDVRLDHEGGEAELLGVYFTDQGQHVEHRSLIHHNASRTNSESVYKGALQGDSRATWYGNIRIEPHAKATASDETNRNLILTDGARADSIPFLEILTADVSRCGHHSSIGQVDELQLFYLESRGIPRQEAMRLLVFGFFAEVTDRIDLPGVTATVLQRIESSIDRGPAVIAHAGGRR